MIKQIILSVCIVAILSSVVLSIPANKGMKEILRIACGLLMIVVVLAPLQKAPKKVLIPKDYTYKIEDSTQEFFNDSIKNDILKNISNRAVELGIDCNIEIKLGEDLSIEEVIIFTESTDQNIENFKQELIKDYGAKKVRREN